MNSIIRFNKVLTEAQRNAIIASAGGSVIRTYSLPELKHICLADIPENMLFALKSHADVETVDEDGTFRITGPAITAIMSAEYDANWGIPHLNVPAVHAKGIRGRGVKIAVLDTGAVDHTDLVMEGSYNAIEPGTPGPDGHGHSHHVSGIIAAQINNQGVVGVAPDVILYCCKVISDSGSGQWSSVITAIVWCIQKGIQVINCSFGGMTYPGEALEEAFQAAADAGIISICSAGNSGAGADTIGWPAKFPSCHAITALGPEDSLASYSSTGPAAVCIAPGSSVKSTYKENGYATMSGTSMSAPFVAGMMALAIEAGISDPVAAIATSCIDLGATGRDNSFGWGLLMADQIVGEGETPKLPRAVRANGSASTDPDGDPIVEWFWTWGNGATTRSSESVVDYTYAADGTYTVSQICWDDKGGVSLPVEQTIMVEQTDQENQPPISVLKVTSQ